MHLPVPLNASTIALTELIRGGGDVNSLIFVLSAPKGNVFLTNNIVCDRKYQVHATVLIHLPKRIIHIRA